MKICFSIGLLVLLSVPGVTQQQSHVTKSTIPFRLTEHNNLSIEAVINGSDTVDLMLHTAVDAVSIIQRVAKDLKSITWSDQAEVQSWGGADVSRSSHGNDLSIQALEWDSLTIWECLHSGPLTDGKFGLNLFGDQIVELNFEEQQVLLQDSLPAKTKDYQQFSLEWTKGMMFIEGTSIVGDSVFENRYLIHSGYGGALLYDDQFVASTGIGNYLEITDTKSLKDSYGNVIQVQKAILPVFQIGDFEFSEVPVGFFEGAIGRQQMSVLGGDLLKRFNILIDLKSRSIYLRPNTLMNLPYAN